MVRKSVFAGAAMVVALSAPAGAACLDEVAQLEQRLSQLPSDDAEQQQTAQQGQPQQAGGEAQVTAITPEGQQQQQQPEQPQQQQPTGGGDTVELEMASGQDVDVPVDEEGTEPAESWFGGSPPAPAGAEEQLDSARSMAEAGDEQGCMSHVEQAARIIAALEEQQGQQGEQPQPQQ